MGCMDAHAPMHSQITTHVHARTSSRTLTHAQAQSRLMSAVHTVGWLSFKHTVLDYALSDLTKSQCAFLRTLLKDDLLVSACTIVHVTPQELARTSVNAATALSAKLVTQSASKPVYNIFAPGPELKSCNHPRTCSIVAGPIVVQSLRALIF